MTTLRANGTTTCCNAYSTFTMDDNVEVCRACYEPITNWETQAMSKPAAAFSITNHQINCRMELERAQRELDEYDVECEQALAKLREEQKRTKARLRAALNEAKGADRRANDPRYS